MSLAPTIAIDLSIYFSKTIAKPRGAKIAAIVNALVSSFTEISVTIIQHERVTPQQVMSVSQTTGTMDELNLSASTFTGVMDAVNHVFLNSQQISWSFQQQAIAIQHGVDAMNALNLVARETASGISQIKASTQQLNDVAQGLQAIV